VDPGGELLVAEPRIILQGLDNLEIDSVESHRCTLLAKKIRLKPSQI
jgi:hypothetical protein